MINPASQPQTFSYFPSHAPPVRVPLTQLDEHDCAYLPGRPSRTRAFRASTLDPDLYHHFMDAGFRRSGDVLYQPVCRGCRACVPIRTPVERFIPTKSQRRVWRRNADLVVEIALPEHTDEKFDLYRKYLTHRHDGSMDANDRAGFESFLYRSPVDTIEFNYYTSEHRLVAVGIADVCARSLSSVYFYFDPDEGRRSIGTYGTLVEFQFCKMNAIPFYYLGYWVGGCATMEYKTQYDPTEYLHTDGQWRKHAQPSD